MSKKLFLHLEKQNAKVNKKKSNQKAGNETDAESNQINTIAKTEHIEHILSDVSKKTRNKKNEGVLVESTEDIENLIIEDTKSLEDVEESVITKNEDSHIDSDDEEVIEPTTVKKKSKKRKKNGLLDEQGQKNKKRTNSTNSDHATKLSGVTSFFIPKVKEEINSSSDDEENVGNFFSIDTYNLFFFFRRL